MKIVCSECKSQNQYHAKWCSRFEKKSLKSDEEYQIILDSGNYPSFDISDLKWIDEWLSVNC